MDLSTDGDAQADVEILPANGEKVAGKATSRVTALDGLRGLLAAVVMISHVLGKIGIHDLFWPSQIAVVIFFLISGYVLTRGWNGRFFPFLLRRAIRLWPVYVLCLLVGYAIHHRPFVWPDLFWLRYVSPDDPASVDPPMWSLILEAWMMPLMPLVVWAGTGGLMRAMLAMLMCGLVFPVIHFALMPFIFIAGAFLSRADFRNSFLESVIPQWLGKISYSLYLSHLLVITAIMAVFGAWGSALAIPVSLLVGWGLWITIEKPSIRLSRVAGRLASGSGPPDQIVGQDGERPKMATSLQ
jgi:peptidoglycan/LPS O-acetylase OafA/YrhL